jgi:hypothetical protein
MKNGTIIKAYTNHDVDGNREFKAKIDGFPDRVILYEDEFEIIETVKTSEDQVRKMKRQVRDFYNKNVNDEKTIRAVARAIGYIIPTPSSDS